MGALVSYGGDPSVIATRAEIERVQAGLAAAANILNNELQLGDFIADPFTNGSFAGNPLKRVGLGLEMPGFSERIQYLLQALDAAANEYFDGEALVAKELTDVGLVSAPLIAAGILLVANDAGLARERPDSLSATKTREFTRSAPTTLAQLARRAENNHLPGQITIEKYGQGFVAYVPGTQTWVPIASRNPLDLTSNLNAMKAPGLAASEKGLELALAKAGAGPNSKILLVGHSQGGLIAANLALRDKRIAGLVTFGAPIGQVAGQLKIPVVAVEHSNDIVPKLGLKANPMTENMVTVTRDLPIYGEKLGSVESAAANPVERIVEAHEISNYAKTAELADDSNEVGIKRLRVQVLDSFGPRLEEGVTSVYELRRN